VLAVLRLIEDNDIMTSDIEALPMERQAAITRRRLDSLQPALAGLSRLAIDTYELLRPLADHVSEVSIDAPLRHQQVHGHPQGGVVADYLMVGFGNHHGLILYNNKGQHLGRGYDWRFSRTIPVAEKKTEETTIKTYFQPEERSDIEVKSFSYAQEIGHNAMLDDYLCTRFDNFHCAENYMQEFETDLQRTIKEFGA
jgi:hypothetical protein